MINNYLGHSTSTGIITKEDLFSKTDLLENEVAYVIEHLMVSGYNKNERSCGGSELKDIVHAGIRGELGEKFRLLKNPLNQNLIKEFVEKILIF